MNDVLTQVLTDLDAETAALDAMVADLDESAEGGWATPTPAPGWTVAHQIGHLAWTDEAALTAAGVVGSWDDLVAAALGDVDGFVDAGAARFAADPALLDRWREGRERLATTLRDLPAGTRLPWFGPPMSATSMATARFMETWAHSLDVAEALGVDVVPNDRVRHVVHLGVRTRDFAFATRDLPAPTEEFRVEVTAPSGEVWAFGPEDAAQRVTGSAHDFARLVTQRVHRDDTDLVAVGADADGWLDIAQCFAGPPGAGRAAS